MKALFFLLALLVAGCVSMETSSSTSIFSVSVSPDDLFTSGTGKAMIDFINTGTTPLRNVRVGIYDAGAVATNDCNHAIGDVKEGSFASRQCTIVAPDAIEQGVITTEIKARATFEATLGGTDALSVMSEDEYRIEQAKGELMSSSPVYVHDDGRLKATVSFSEQMPVIKRPDKKLYMYVDIANVGAGRIEAIEAGNILVNGAASVEKRIDAKEGGTKRIAGTVNVVSNERGYDEVETILYRFSDSADSSKKDTYIATARLISAYTVGDASLQYMFTGLKDETYIVVATVKRNGNHYDTSLKKRDCPSSPIDGSPRDCVVMAGATQDFTIPLTGDIGAPADECKGRGFGSSACIKCTDESYIAGSDVTKCYSYVTPTAGSPLGVTCPSQKLYIQGSAFPRVTCEVALPANINYLSDYTLILSIDYPYEIRASQTVQVRR